MPLSSEFKTADPKEVVIRFLELMGTGKADQQEEAGRLFADDADFWIAGDTAISGTVRGREAIMEKRFRPARGRVVPGSVRLQLGKVISDGEFVAAEWTSQRQVVDGRPYSNAFFGLFEVKAGKITMLREYMDTAAVKESGWLHIDRNG
jgi:hypothetical protein